MTDERILEMAKQARFDVFNNQIYTFAGEDEISKKLKHLAQLVRNEALEEAAESLYGNGLEMSLLQDLRKEIRSLKS